MEDVLFIVWDWNGTLLDDIDLSVYSANIMLEKRNLKKISKSQYQEIFTFPLEKYYIKAGFDLNMESYNQLSNEYMGIYLQNSRLSSLHQGIVDVVRHLKNMGLMQYILSSMEKKDLLDTLYSKGINHYFKNIYGNEGRLSEGKIILGRKLIEREKIDPKNTLIIGDTLHDLEVAQALGTQVALIASGHYSFPRLKTGGVKVYNTIQDLVNARF